MTTTEGSSPETPSIKQKSDEMLRSMIRSVLDDLRNGAGDRDKRRQAEDWLKGLAEKYPAFAIRPGLREYYLAEAGRLRQEFDQTEDLTERLNLGRQMESFLEKANDIEI